MYVRNKNVTILEYSPKHKLDLDLIEKAIGIANESFASLQERHKYDPANFIPLRNFSGGVGEAFAAILCDLCPDMISNPHPDGYPDILPNIEEAKPWITAPIRKDFLLGGFDAKAKFVKFDERIDTGASAHHNHTTSVLNVMWSHNLNDRYSCQPMIMGVTYMNGLKPSDWSQLKPAKEGSKSTPSCSLSRQGKVKFRENWLFLHKSAISRLCSKGDWLGYDERGWVDYE